MKKIEDVWANAWGKVSSLKELYGTYGTKNMAWCFRSLLSGEKKDRVLDAGCGAGFYFSCYKGLGFSELCGIECNEDNIEKARELNRGITDPRIIRSDIRDLPEPFGENYFDMVTSMGLVEHFAYPVNIVRKLLRAVREKGVLILEMPNFRNWTFYSHNIRIKDSLPFHLWWGVKEWCRVLGNIKGCRLEKVQTANIWSYNSYLPWVVKRISPRLLDLEIAAENTLFKRSGAFAFYKLRKL